MPHSAPQNRKNILITDVGSYLGKSLAEYFLSRNHSVFGLRRSHVDPSLLANRSFTLLDLDLNQPIPSHLPPFELICFLITEKPLDKELFGYYTLPHDLNNTIAYSKNNGNKLFIFAPKNQPADLQDFLVRDVENKDLITLFILGDLYGPGMNLNEPGLLTQIISQAISSDRIVLANEGQDYIYPSYIFDVTSHVGKILIQKGTQVEYLISSEPQTSLNMAYEIQKIAFTNHHKDYRLFFQGPQSTSQPPSLHQLPIMPAGSSLHVGLKSTINFFADHPVSRQSQAKAQSPVPAAQTPIAAYKLKTAEITKPPDNSPKIRKITQKWRISGKSPFKMASVGIIAVLLLFFVKTSTDLLFGLSHLKSAKKALSGSNLQKAESEAQKAAMSFESASVSIEKLLYPASFIFRSQIESLNSNLTALSKSASALSSLAAAASSLSQNINLIVSAKPDAKPLDLETPVINFQKAYLESSQAQKLLEVYSLPFMSAQTQSLREANAQSVQIAGIGSAIVHLIADFTGTAENRTYLMLLQNNMELRPGGGFIGSIGLVEFEKGRLKNISVDDVYNLDGQLQEKIEPPKELKDKLGVDRFYLRDSNWTPDFQLNSQTARDFYKKETGKTVDGVIALDLTLMQKLLNIIGPVKLADYDEEITGENLFEKGEFHSEIGFFPGSTQKKDFFSALTKNVIEELVKDLSSPSDSASPLAILGTFHEGISQKHLMFSFDDPQLTSYLTVNGLNNTLTPTGFDPGDDSRETRDFLAISEANIGANKVNRYIGRSIDFEMTIGRDADLLGTLNITYTNNSQAETWPGGKYANFIRLYLPAGTSLEDFVLDPPLPPQAPPTPAPVRRTRVIEEPPLEEGDVKVTAQGNLTVFSVFVEIPVKSTKTVTFKYRVHKNIKLETAPTYHLYVQKQPGTEKDPFTLTFNLPNYLTVKSINGKEAEGQNIKITSDLATDRQFEIEIAKK